MLLLSEMAQSFNTCA